MQEEAVDLHFQPAKEFRLFGGWNWRNLSPKQRLSRAAMCLILIAIGAVSAVSFLNAARIVNDSFPGFLVTPRLTVANTVQSYWTGVRAGLRYPDKILSVNRARVSSVAEFKNAVRNRDVGAVVLYEVERQGKIFEAAVPTMTFSWLDFSTTFGLEFVSGLAYLVIGIVVFILKPDTGVSWSFFLLCSSLALYNISDFDKGETGLARVYMLAMTFIPAAGLHLSVLFPERKRVADSFPGIRYLPYIVSTVLLIPLAALYPRDAFRPFYQFTLLYLIFAAIVLVAATFHSYTRSPSVLARQRGKVVLGGAAIAFPLPAVVHYLSFFGVSSTNFDIVATFLPLPIIVFPASIAYAIARHNLFDVDVYIKRAVGYGIMTAIVAMGYFSIQAFTSTFLFGPLFGEYAERAYPIVFALLVVFFFNPINKRIQDAVDRLFFRKQFDYKETVRTVSNALTSLLNLDEILERVVQTLRKEMFIDTVGVVVLEPERKAARSYFAGEGQQGRGANLQRDVQLRYDDPLLSLIVNEQRLITKYDIAEDPRYAHLIESCGRTFSELAASLALPMIYQGQVTGVLALGHKKSGHFFTREDVDLLDTMADQAAVAIENAKLAEQMKKEETVRTNLSRYLSPQIVDQIVQQGVQVNLGGDKKVVTVLFSDIRNFTGITETQPPDKLVRLLNEYFTEMAGIIFAHQGSLDKYIGDAIVAVFGSLIDLENSAHNAAQAAVQMMQRLPNLNERWKREYGFEMQIGIGLNTGEVFLGNIGSSERMEFTVIGDTVNVASRLSGLAKPGQILVTRDTLTRLGTEIGYNDLPPTEVKGKTGKVEVYEIVARRS